MESLGEFKKSQKFARQFVEGNGMTTGEYLKKNRKLVSLKVLGSSDATSLAIASAVLKSAKTPAEGGQLLEKFGSQNLRNYSTISDNIEYTFTMLGIEPLFMMRNVTDIVPTQAELRNEYVTPTLGIVLEKFKSHFNSHMSKVNKQLQIKGQGIETTSPTYVIFDLNAKTRIHIHTNEKMIIEDIELDGNQPEYKAFWQCAYGVISGLHPNYPKAKNAELYSRIGPTVEGLGPIEDVEFEDENMLYVCKTSKFMGGFSLCVQSYLP